MAPKRKPPTKRRKTASKEGNADPEVSKETIEETREDRLLSKMRVIMDSVQKGFTNVLKNIEKMWEIKQKYDGFLFFDNFWYCLRHACLVAAREPPTERIIQFCCKFAIKADLPKENLAEEEITQTGPFAIKLFNTALQYHDANNKAVRFRLCQIINLLLTSMGGDAEIDEELYNKIYNCMLDRLKDKVPGVRVQAVNTLNRLQDPADPECPVMKGYLKIMKTDGVAEVRRAAVRAIAINSKSLLPIIERTRDTNPAVRKATYGVLVEKISIRAMKISYRMRVLETGLRDRHMGVKDMCISLIKKWVLFYENDIVKLLKAMDVEGKVDLCTDIVKEILGQVHIDVATECLYKRLENKVIPSDQLSCENVFYWGCLISYCIDNHPEIYDKIMPTLTDFSVYLKEYIILASQIEAEDYDAHYQASYVIIELIKIAKLADFSDEAGRRSMIAVNKFIITEGEITVQAVEKLVELYCLAEPDEKTRIQTIAAIINDIRNPLEGATQFNIDCIESCEKNDPVTMIRCLTMVSGLVQGVHCDVAFDPTLSALLDDVIMTGVISDNEIVRHLAIKALGCSCILSKTLAKKYLIFFLQVVMVDNYTEILETTLKIIFDLLLVFGLETFAEEEKKNLPNGGDIAGGSDANSTHDTTLTNTTPVDVISSRLEGTVLKEDPENPLQSKIEQETQGFADRMIEKFKEFLDDEVLRNVSAEGIAKLMYNGRLLDAQLFSRLLLLWFNPITEGDSLRHCLGMFFNTFGATNDEDLEVVEQAFFPTIQTICNAPHTSPLLEVNPQSVAELMLSLLRGTRNVQLAIKMCNEILITPKSSYGRTLIKTLSHCTHVFSADQSNLKLIHSLVKQILEEVEHISTKKSLTSYISRLEAFIETPSEEEDKENILTTQTTNSSQISDKTMSQDSSMSVQKRKQLFMAPSQPLDLLDTIT